MPPRSTPRPPRLPLWKRALYSLVVVTALLGTTEAGLRLLFGPPPPPTVVYNAYRQHTSWFLEAGGEVRAAFVDLDPPAPFPAQTDQKRCAVLGGSSVHGGSPDIASTGEFPALIAAQVGFPVVNLGAPGLDSFDHRAMLAELLRYPWSCLILYGGHNDFGNTYFQSRYGSLSSGLQARARAGLERFQLFAQLHRLLSPPEQSGERRGGMPTSTEGLIDETRWWAALRYLEANTRSMLWMAKQTGVPVLVVSPVSDLQQSPGQRFCTGPDCAVDLYNQASRVYSSNPTEAAALLRRARDLDRLPLRAPSAAQAALKRAAEEAGAIWVDAEARLPQDSALPVPARSLFRDAVHFTTEGHAAMAKLLAPEVKQMVGGS